MPQFDFATFTPQIFWLLICFGVLYYAVSNIILPRISAILEDRENRINSDLKSAEKLQNKINQFQENSLKLREQSNSSYHKAIENTLKECTLNREKALNKAKSEIEKITIQSEETISHFIERSKNQYDEAASSIADTLVKKIFGEHLKFDKEVKVALDKFEN